MTEKTVEQLLSEVNDLKMQTATAGTSRAGFDAVHSGASSFEDSFMLSVMVISFGAFICVCITILIIKRHSADNILRPFGTILIIIGSLFLIVAGYSEQQISPVIGLLGTIAGYVLGKDSARQQNTSPSSSSGSVP